MEFIKILTKIFLILILKEYNAHSANVTTLERIQNEGYTGEEHQIETDDGYILTVFRIPNGKVTAEESPNQRPLVLLMHDFYCSSDSWILNGPTQALPFILADAGYDVWLANDRGNSYSRNHTELSASEPQFWRFSFHEMGIYDLPAIIDYMLYETGQTQLDYIGHSQGATAMFALLSTKPDYNDKFKSAQLLGPIAYDSHTKGPGLQVIATLLGQPDGVAELLGSMEFVPNNELLVSLGSELCNEQAPVPSVCSNFLFLLAGYDSEMLNQTLLPEIFETHPDTTSVDLFIHYSQLFVSAEFREYDFGPEENLLKYNSTSPPDYRLGKVRVPTYVYYGKNDWLAPVEDIEITLTHLPNVKLAHLMPDEKWNHLDFLWASDIKSKLYDFVVENMKK